MACRAGRARRRHCPVGTQVVRAGDTRVGPDASCQHKDEGRMAAIVTLRRRTRCASRMTPSSTRSTTTTVTLSWPPAASAASTRLSTQICAVEDCVAMFSISLSGIMLERPSEHRIRRSPSSICRVKWSAYMAGSEPSARVMTERLGWTRASSAVISPASTSSST